MDTRTKQSLKERDRVNPYYIPELEGHRHPLLAAALPHTEIVLVLCLAMIGGGVAATLGYLISGIAVAGVSAVLLAIAGFVRLIDPAKKKKQR